MGIELGIAVGDNHGAFINQAAKRQLLDWCAEYKPKHRIHLGDNFDFACIRSRAYEAEESKGLNGDVLDGKRFLDEFRPTVFLMGNHEARIYHLAERRVGIVRDFAIACIADIERHIGRHAKVIVPYKVKQPYRLGDHSFIHGFSCGVNAARDHAAWFGNCIIGHLHRDETKRARRIEGATCHVAGGLYDEAHLDYAHERGTILEWCNSAVRVTYNNKTGRTSCYHLMLGTN